MTTDLTDELRRATVRKITPRINPEPIEGTDVTVDADAIALTAHACLWAAHLRHRHHDDKPTRAAINCAVAWAIRFRHRPASNAPSIRAFGHGYPTVTDQQVQQAWTGLRAAGWIDDDDPDEPPELTFPERQMT